MIKQLAKSLKGQFTHNENSVIYIFYDYFFYGTQKKIFRRTELTGPI